MRFDLEKKDAEIARLKAEAERFAAREGKASVRLCARGYPHPFMFFDCDVVDFGHADNGYVVECEEFEKQLKRAEYVERRLAKAVDALRKTMVELVYCASQLTAKGMVVTPGGSVDTALGSAREILAEMEDGHEQG